MCMMWAGGMQWKSDTNIHLILSEMFRILISVGYYGLYLYPIAWPKPVEVFYSFAFAMHFSLKRIGI